MPFSLKDNWKKILLKCKKQDQAYKKKKLLSFIRTYKKNIIKEPEAPLWYFLYGRALGLLQKKQKALRLFSISIQKNPYFIWGYYGIGLYYLKNNDHFQAKIYFQKSLFYEPTFAPAFIGLAKIALKTNYDKTIQYLKKAVQYLPKDIGLLLQISNVFIIKQKYSNAEKYLLRAKKLSKKIKGY